MASDKPEEELPEEEIIDTDVPQNKLPGESAPVSDDEFDEDDADDEFEEEEFEEEDEDEPQDLETQLRVASDEEDEEENAQEGDEELSLEQLSASYATVLKVVPPAAEPETEELPAEIETVAELDNDSCPTTPQAIIEALLFVGRSDSGEIAGKEIASLMRGVDEAEVGRLVDELNSTYQRNGHALHIARVGSGYKVVLDEELSYVRDRFYGRVRDIKLNQAAIDCLALVAYQPGIGRKALDDQRGQSSGSVLNQLVRRQLLEVRREGKGKTAETHYFPTDKMLHLAGLASLDDLPQVEDLN